MTTNQKLIEENKKLKKLLSSAKKRMKKEIKIQIHSLFQNNNKLKNINEEKIINKIYDFFNDTLLINTPNAFIENITIAEINFCNMQENMTIDGLAVIAAYQKAFDAIIESCITQGFRKYAQKRGCTMLKINHPLEKSLHSTVTLGYTIGVGKLFHVIEVIKKQEHSGAYSKCFENYLKKFNYLEKILIHDIIFYKKLRNIVHSEVFGKKRHLGKISFNETKEVRQDIVGNYKDKNCIFYKLLEILSVF